MFFLRVFVNFDNIFVMLRYFQFINERIEVKLLVVKYFVEDYKVRMVELVIFKNNREGELNIEFSLK